MKKPWTFLVRNNNRSYIYVSVFTLFGYWAEQGSQKESTPGFSFISVWKSLSILLVTDYVVMCKHVQNILLRGQWWIRPNMILCWNIYLFSKYDYDQTTRLSKPVILKWPTRWKTMHLSSEQSIKCGIHKCKHSNLEMSSKEYIGPSNAPVASFRTVAVI